MRIRLFATVCTVAGLLALASVAKADQPALVLNPVGVDFTNGTWSLGWEFVANNNLTVTGLGFYDDLDNDLTESHDVAIYDSAANIVSIATVNPGDPLNTHFRYAGAGGGLTAGSTYFIVAETGTENYNFGGAVAVDSNITFVQDAFIFSPLLAFPTSSTGFGNAYFGPNFTFVTSVPEPGTVAFGILAGGSLLGLIARKRKA